MILRSEPKDDHAPIVDIAGNTFIAAANNRIVTGVWPLKSWTAPTGDNVDAALSGLAVNTGVTYTRGDNKT